MFKLIDEEKKPLKKDTVDFLQNKNKKNNFKLGRLKETLKLILV